MARTREAEALTRDQRAKQLALRAGSLKQLVVLYRTVDPTRLRATLDTFVDAAVELQRGRHQESAALAATYYRLFRRADGVRGTFDPLPAPPPPAGYVAGQLRGSLLSGILTSRRAGSSVRQAANNGLIKAIGKFGMLILSGGVSTITSAVNNDPEAIGWYRVGSDDPCPFCRMLISRGAAYKSEAGADFKPHDHCACIAEPAYSDTVPTAQTLDFQLEWTTAQQWARDNVARKRSTSNNALNNYRQWLAAGKPEPGDTPPVGGNGSTRE